MGLDHLIMSFSIAKLFLSHHSLLVKSFKNLTTFFRWWLLLIDNLGLLETNSTLTALKFFLEYLFGVKINLGLVILP